MEYKVYVLRNSAGKLCIGVSSDVAVRLDQHNQGESKWTKGKGPWTLSWTSQATSLSDARKLENRLKRQKGGAGLRQCQFPTGNLLAPFCKTRVASIYQRRLTWWVEFYHPLTGKPTRESLDTHDRARAELLRQRVELEVALLDPRFEAAEAPGS